LTCLVGVQSFCLRGHDPWPLWFPWTRSHSTLRASTPLESAGPPLRPCCRSHEVGADGRDLHHGGSTLVLRDSTPWRCDAGSGGHPPHLLSGVRLRSVMQAPSSTEQRNTPPRWIVAFESPFGCPESVNVILGRNLERILQRFCGACWWPKALLRSAK
jgi:hypothetical protein